ncbi:S-adenosyl-L-methionine-dependent methyltransferase [Cubamyces menziesii]|nr:S-adenosyl-L-methionine-dependent methyltransferase [Cubamyces menziesii]
MSTLAALRALHDTIGNALADIESVYRGKSLDYPSLSAPYYHQLSVDISSSAAPPPTPEQKAAEELTIDPAVVQASNFIVAACGQLAAAVHHPFFTILEGAHYGHITSVLGFLEASHTVEILRDAGPQGLHAKDIARQIEEIHLGKDAPTRDDIDHLDPAHLIHVLRLLATHHMLQEVAPDVFANNRFSSSLDSGKTLEQLRTTPEKKYDGTNGGGAYVGFATKEMFRSVTYLTEWLLPSVKTSKPKPATPFGVAFDTDNFYEFMERPENAYRLTQFTRSMSGARATQGEKTIATQSALKWETLPKDSVVVDVGGGIGAVSIQIAESYPHLRFIVQDRAPTVAMAPTLWGDAHKDLFESGRVSLQAQDFFQPQPAALDVPGVGPVAHPAAYVTARVMHNWPDAQCKHILKNLRAAAGPDTKLIINDTILPLACEDPATTSAEDGPTLPPLVPKGSAILPNMGNATLSGYLVDISMMTVLNAKERTLEEFKALALSAGWKVVSVDRCSPPIPWGFIVAVPV